MAYVDKRPAWGFFRGKDGKIHPLCGGHKGKAGSREVQSPAKRRKS